MKQTETRKKLVELDKLGINESFEARIRGMLTPYSTLLAILNEPDFNSSKYKEILDELKSSVYLEKILFLLTESEKDRIELENNEK